jgi:hypothetical protein
MTEHRLEGRSAAPGMALGVLVQLHDGPVRRVTSGDPVAEKRRALASDPHAYAMAADPQLRALAEAEAPVQQIATASIEAQRRMGVPEGKLRILSNASVERMAETLRITGPETADLAPRLAALAQEFGPLWGRAYGELVQHGKVPWPVQALVGMTAPQQAEGRAGLQAALRFVAERGPDALNKLIPADEVKTIPAETETAMADFAEATRHHPGGNGLRATMREAVDLLARWHASRGMKAADAAQRAYEDVIGARWDTAGDDGSGIFGRTPTMLVPKGEAGRIETALDQVRGAIKPADLAPLADPLNPGATEQQLRDATLKAAQRGIWINNADASGAVLKGRTPGGQIIDILDSEGRPIEVRFAGLQQNLGFVFENFYTEEEQYRIGIQKLGATFAQYGQQIPQTRDAFLSLLNSLDLNDAAQSDLYTTMLRVAP